MYYADEIFWRITVPIIISIFIATYIMYNKKIKIIVYYNDCMP